MAVIFVRNINAIVAMNAAGELEKEVVRDYGERLFTAETRVVRKNSRSPFDGLRTNG